MPSISRRDFLTGFGLGAAVATVPGCKTGAAPRAGAARRRPNVIVILTDDQGYGDLSCHGHPLLKTPNLDRLHGESVRFTDFHVVPMCSPTRGELMTGVDCLRNGASATCMGRHIPRAGLPLLPEPFAAAGYRTGLFGKWHLGNTYPYRPMDRGFEETATFQGFGLVSADEHWNNDYFDPWYLHNGVRKQGKGYCTDFWFDQAMAWMDGCRARHEPFFAYLPTNAPHFPFWVDGRYRQPYEPSELAAFYGMIANVDENVGRLDAFLARSGLKDNTILVYLTDNGHAGGSKQNPFNAGMRGGKCARYDGGHRVPCFVRWPGGGLRPAGDVDTPAQVQDLFPTLLELCDLPVPPAARFDGASLAALLRGGSLADRKLVMQYCQGGIARDDAAVIWGRWRLVFGKELYDIRTDPGQARDVAAEHPDIVASLRAHYDAWWAGVEPRVNAFSPAYLGTDREPRVRLTCCEWQDVRADGAESVRLANAKDPARKGGRWHVQVVQAGTYEIELRRWPEESGLALTEASPEFRGRVGTLAPGVALPIASARLVVADGAEQAAPAEAGAPSIVVEVPLPAGRTTLHAWFCDADGAPLSGAFFAYVRRVA